MMILVAAAAILRDGSVLLCQRSEHVTLPFLWEFPGGKIEINESTEEGLARELNEELGVNCQIGEQVAETIHHYEHGSFNIKLFVATLLSNVNEFYNLTAHSRYVWVPLRDLQNFSILNEFIPSNLGFVRQISGLRSCCLVHSSESK